MVARSRCFNSPINLLIVAASHIVLRMCGGTQVCTDRRSLGSKVTFDPGCWRAEIMQRKMTRIGLLLSAAFVLPVLVLCDYPWPDKVTQHKGYIEVNCLT